MTILGSPSSDAEFPGGHITFDLDTLCDHPGDGLVSPRGQGDVTIDIIAALNSWLNREVKQHLQNIDSKLADLLTHVRANAALEKSQSDKSERLRARKPSVFAQAAIMEAPLLNEQFPKAKISVGSHRPLVREQLAIGSRHGSEDSLQAYREEELPDRPSDRKRRISGFDVAGPLIHNTISKFMNYTHLSSMFQPDARSRAREQKLQMIRETISTYQHIRGKRAAAIWRFFENRYSSSLAMVYATFIPFFVFCSVVVSFWETVDGCPLRGPVGDALQTCFESVFAIELVSRFLVCPDRIQFWQDPFNYVDLLSALPVGFRIIVSFLTMAGKDIDAQELISSIAVVPVLRLLKLSRRFEKFQLLLSAFIMAIEALPVLLYSLIVIALFFSALIYFAEPPENVTSLPHALWFIIVTMTTVGYGDVTPETPLGHCIMMFLMVISGLYMAMPIGIVGNAFSQSWGARDRLLLMHRMREAFLQQGFSAHALHNIIMLFDGDGDGEIGLEEFMDLLDVMNIHMSQERVAMLLDSLDTDASGNISVDELMNGLFPRNYAEMFKSLSKEMFLSSTTSSSFQWTSEQVSNFKKRSELQSSSDTQGSTSASKDDVTKFLTARSRVLPQSVNAHVQVQNFPPTTEEEVVSSHFDETSDASGTDGFRQISPSAKLFSLVL